MPVDLKGHKNTVWATSFNNKKQILASCSSDKTIRIWGLRNTKWCQISVIDGIHQKTIRSIDWSPCGNLLASCSFDGTINIFVVDKNNSDLELISSLEGHENEVKCVRWHSNGTYFASCGRDKTVWIWGIEENREIDCVAILNGHTQDVKFIAWHPIDSVLFSCSYDETIRVWKSTSSFDDDEWYCNEILNEHKSTVWSLSLADNGKLMFSGDQSGKLIIWSIREKKWFPKNELNLHQMPIYSISFCSQLNYLATASGDNEIAMIKFEKDYSIKNERITKLKSHNQDVNSVQFIKTENNNFLASAGDDFLVKIWKFDEF